MQSHYNVRYRVSAVGSLLRRMLFSGKNPSRCREYYFQTCSSFAPFAAALATLFFPDFTVKADGRNYRSYFRTYLFLLIGATAHEYTRFLLFQMHM